MKKLRKVPTAFHSTEMDDEVVIIHGGTGKFYALKEVGLAVWNAIDAGDDLDSVCLALEQAYGIDSVTCRAEVAAFADQLVEVGFAEYV